jgi:alkylhydroperoxidase family enzyme
VTRLASRPELDPARRHAGSALAALESAHDAACRAVDPVLADAMRLRVAEQIGALPPASSTPVATDRDRVCCDFADQFVVYVPGITEEQRDAVAAELGPEQALELARMVYVFDMTDRLTLSLGRLFEPRGVDVEAIEPVEPAEPQPLAAAVDGLHAAAMQLHALDPVTTELVRLHCARYHDCKT